MRDVILVVDDDVANLALAKKILNNDYKVIPANSGRAAFAYLEKNIPNLMLLDINMPEMDGFEILEKIRKIPEYQNIPVIFLTAEKNAETETKCFRAGAIDFVGKPFVPDILLSRVKRTLELEEYHTELERMVEKQAEIITTRTRKINEIQEHVITGLANLIESRDDSTGKHVKHTQIYVDMLAKELKRRNLYTDVLTEEFMQHLHKAAPLHDVGKIKVSDAILQKPARLTDEEFTQMKKHTEYGKDVLRDILGNIEEEEYIKVAIEVALYHHERWDGKGYPCGLKEDEIPVAARIMAIADVFDAIYEERCYKPPVRPVAKVLNIIEECAGSQFDPQMAKVFCEMKDEICMVVGEK